ncbi:hypothetical protein HAALTHF_00480n [Vreelandella aquamarina]|nr:hypothetical protein HAALTHF_00480n [Halomonas axialensis]
MNSPVWHPYAHLKTQTPAPKVVGGSGSYFTLDSGERLLDATCSWWCMIHGYGHPRLVAAIREQAGELCHVMLGGLTHGPADQLARALVRITAGAKPRVLLRQRFGGHGGGHEDGAAVSGAYRPARQAQDALADEGVPWRHHRLHGSMRPRRGHARPVRQPAASAPLRPGPHGTPSMPRQPR